MNPLCRPPFIRRSPTAPDNPPLPPSPISSHPPRALPLFLEDPQTICAHLSAFPTQCVTRLTLLRSHPQSLAGCSFIPPPYAQHGEQPAVVASCKNQKAHGVTMLGGGSEDGQQLSVWDRPPSPSHSGPWHCFHPGLMRTAARSSSPQTCSAQLNSRAYDNPSHHSHCCRGRGYY